MPRATYLQTSFTGGEWSPAAYGRADLSKYKTALETCLNYVPTVQGGLTRRPGTKYVTNVKDSNAGVRLIPYEFSVSQAYILEFGNRYVRFYTNGGQLLNNTSSTYKSATVTFNTTGSVVTWTAHGLVEGNAVAFTGGTIPTGLVSGSVYYVGPSPTANTFTLTDVAGISVTFTTAGSGTITGVAVYLQGQLATYSGSTYVSLAPSIYPPGVNQAVTFTTGTPTFGSGTAGVNLTNHGLIVGNTVSFAAGTGGALPAAITAGTTYYVSEVVSANLFRIASTLGGTNITFATAGTVGSTPNTVTLSSNFWYQQTSTAYELPTQYSTADLWQIVFVQSADVLYLAHNAYTPVKLQRFGAQQWAFTPLNLLDGPYLPTNTTATTFIVGSSTAGLIGWNPGFTYTLTASSATGINGGAGFRASDVGRDVRMTWTAASTTAGQAGVTVNGWGVITYVETKFVARLKWIVAPQTPTSGYTAPTWTTGITTWRLGAYTSTLGFPGAICFHQDRLVFGGTTSYPNRLDFSNTSDYENFAPSSISTTTSGGGTVIDSNALSFNINSAKMNVINWMVSDEWGLLVGTASSEWVVSPAITGIALTPTNINVKQVSTYGGADIYPARMGKTTFFIQRTQRKLRAMSFKFVANSFEAPDVSVLAEHLTTTGIRQIAVALAPHPNMWMVRNDGTMVGMIYDPDQEVLGWHQHKLGGFSDAAKTTNALIESVACIPSQNTTYDELWVSVKRYINGAVVRTIEQVTKYWENGDTIDNSFFVDCGATYTAPSGTYTRSTTTLTATFTTAHGLSTGNQAYFKFSDVSLNGLYTVTVTSTTGLTITTATSSSTPGTISLAKNSISGFTWLPNETVGVLVEGATHPDVVVSSGGVVSLNAYYTKVTVGYKYNSDGKTLRIEAGGGDGPAQAKLKRIHRIMVRYFQSVGTQIMATGINNLYAEPFRTSADPMSGPVALFTGDKRFSWEGTYELEGQVFWRQNDPLPSNILMIGAQLDTQDGG